MAQHTWAQQYQALEEEESQWQRLLGSQLSAAVEVTPAVPSICAQTLS